MHASKARRIAKDKSKNLLLSKVFVEVQTLCMRGEFQLFLPVDDYSSYIIDKTIIKLKFRGYAAELKEIQRHMQNNVKYKYLLVSWRSREKKKPV